MVLGFFLLLRAFVVCKWLPLTALTNCSRLIHFPLCDCMFSEEPVYLYLVGFKFIIFAYILSAFVKNEWNANIIRSRINIVSRQNVIIICPELIWQFAINFPHTRISIKRTMRLVSHLLMPCTLWGKQPIRKNYTQDHLTSLNNVQESSKNLDR